MFDTTLCGVHLLVLKITLKNYNKTISLS